MSTGANGVLVRAMNEKPEEILIIYRASGNIHTSHFVVSNESLAFFAKIAEIHVNQVISKDFKAGPPDMVALKPVGPKA